MKRLMLRKIRSTGDGWGRLIDFKCDVWVEAEPC